MSQSNRRRRVCIVGPSSRFFSGITAYTICLTNALSTSYDTSAVLLRKLLPRFLYPGKGQVARSDHRLQFSPTVVLFDGMDWNSPLTWLRAYRFLKKERPQFIVMQWWTSSVVHMQLLLAIANRLSIKARLLLEMHEVIDPLEQTILPVRLYSRIMARLLICMVDRFVVHAKAVKQLVMKVYGLKEDRVSVIPHPLYDVYCTARDSARSRAKLGFSHEFIILYFGLIRRYKGVPFLVEAFNKLPRDMALSSRLVIVGENWGDETGLDELVASSPYATQIMYEPRFVPDETVADYFGACDVVVLPYLRTAGSGVASIAMAHGKPLIISDLEALSESVSGYAGAMLTPVGCSETISQKMIEVHTRWKAGEDLVFASLGNTWDGMPRRYEPIFAQLEAMEVR